jgi:hypothetical protein
MRQPLYLAVTFIFGIVLALAVIGFALMLYNHAVYLSCIDCAEV